MSGRVSFADPPAFSLVELLVVIAVIAVIAAIAIPNIAGITGSAHEAKARRNAQTIASIYSAAIAAGMPLDAATNVSEAVAIVVAGTNVQVGNTLHTYSVDGLTPAESLEAQVHLGFTNGTIVFLAPQD